ncbi:hypothetical protein [Yeosuana sp.]|uniref:hypothetical protein n=1 Tax=Yeosuana sp. TaxID=2529388 RepID=UPI0040550D15|tara:strand:- start:7 stop:600 length:594 start_codon:yes stop_codon:yes gene_type:complete
MKKIFIYTFILAFSYLGHTQNKIVFGIKAGMNYNSNGDLIALSEFESYIGESKARVGYHAGVWLEGEIPSTLLFIRPELLYTQTKSTYDLGGTEDFILKKIDIPVIVGVKIFKVARVFVGPVFQFLIDSKYENIYPIETDSFALALNLGIGFQLGKFGLDIRWEKGLSNSETILFKDLVTLDNKPNQLITGVTYKVW